MGGRDHSWECPWCGWYHGGLNDELCDTTCACPMCSDRRLEMLEEMGNRMAADGVVPSGCPKQEKEMADISNHPVLGVLEDMRETVASKAHDYADTSDVYSNFTGSAKLANVDVGTVFQVLIGIKVERLRQLTSGKEPNHEGIEDTLLDLANYAALWLGFRREEEGHINRTVLQQLELDFAREVGYNVGIEGVPV